MINSITIIQFERKSQVPKSKKLSSQMLFFCCSVSTKQRKYTGNPKCDKVYGFPCISHTKLISWAIRIKSFHTGEIFLVINWKLLLKVYSMIIVPMLIFAEKLAPFTNSQRSVVGSKNSKISISPQYSMLVNDTIQCQASHDFTSNPPCCRIVPCIWIFAIMTFKRVIWDLHRC